MSQHRMSRIYVYIISITLLLNSFWQQAGAQDTIMFPMKVRLGFELLGSSKYFYEKERTNLEFTVSADLNERVSAVLSLGKTDHSYKRYRDTSFLLYNYTTNGTYYKAGLDFNLLKADKSQGKYFVGMGIRYGMSHFTYEIPEITTENYWGRTVTKVPRTDEWAQYIEFTPGVRAEFIKNISMGWTVSLRKMIDPGTGRHQKPVYLPGYGNGSKSFSPGVNYYIIWSIPFRTRRVIIQPEPEEEEEDMNNPNQNSDMNNNGGFRQQSGASRF